MYVCMYVYMCIYIYIKNIKYKYKYEYNYFNCGVTGLKQLTRAPSPTLGNPCHSLQVLWNHGS